MLCDVRPAEKSAMSDDVKFQLAEGIRQVLNRSMKASLLSTLAFAAVMLQGV